MNYKVAILGSTGSIGDTTLNSLYKKKGYKIILLTSKKILKNFILKQLNLMWKM